MNEYTVEVTPDTKIEMKDLEIDFEDLIVGMTVRVCGKMIGDVLVADHIMVMFKGKLM